MMDKILAIVVTHNGIGWMDRCLGSLESSSFKTDTLVVDNCSTDGTPDYIAEHFPDAILFRGKENIGFGAANNIGLRYALENGYDFVYLLNQDAWVKKDTIATLHDSWNKAYGVLSPVQVDAKGKMDANFRKKCGKYLREAGDSVDGDRLIVRVPFVMAAHWLMSRKAIETTGGFSPAFKQYGEDDNYLDRMHWHGLRSGVVPAAEGVHDRSDRKTSREDRMRLKCVSTVIKLSDPGRSFLFRSLVEPLELIGMTVKNFSLVPVRFIPELTARYKELKTLRKASRKDGAFL